jgi:hypothetical protein
VALAVAYAAAGCVSSGQISRRSVNYNLAVENARNEMLLLNVLRARERRAMVFTGLTRITGSLRNEGHVGVSGTVGQGMPNNAQLGPSFDASDAPTFDVAVLDSQEFTRGIMTPLSFPLVEYFWDQGYPREILLYLGVERIEVSCPSGELKSYENDPTERTFPAFRRLLEALADGGAWDSENASALVGPPVDAAQAGQLPSLVRLASAHLRLAATKDGRFQLVRPGEQRRLLVRDLDGCSAAANDHAPGWRTAFYDSKEALADAQPQPGLRLARLVLRSPQSVVFYLGEMARAGREVAIRPRSAGQPVNERRLLVVRTAHECPRAVIGADWAGKRWVIPDGKDDCHPGRSLQSLALTEQLLALQQSAHDLPASGTVRVIGQ